MSNIKRQFETYSGPYYPTEVEPGRIMRTQKVPANYIDAQMFYATQPGQILNKRDRNIEPPERYDEYSEGYYEDTDQEARIMYNPHQTMDYPVDRQNVPPRNYYTVSPGGYRNVKMTGVPKSHSPYMGGGTTYYTQPIEHVEGHKANRYQIRQHFRDNDSDLDEREAQLFSSMSQAELKDHVIQNANVDEYDVKDKSEFIIDQLHKKIGKLSKQYLTLVKEVKKSDYMRGFNTSVSYAQLKELENIRDKFDASSNESGKDSDIFKAVRTATQEIEEVLTHNGTSLSINDIIKYVKKQFYQVFIHNRSELEDHAMTPQPEISNIEKFRDTGDLDCIKGKLNFQTAMNDLTKNYEWLKEKSFKSLEGLEEKYNQIDAELSELTQRMSSYSLMDAPIMKENNNLSEKFVNLKDTEKKIIVNVIEDVWGLVGYTCDAVTVTIQNSYEDINVLRDAISEYHELLEDKIKKLPNIISSSNLKAEGKELKGDQLYDMFLADQDRSEKSENSRTDNYAEKELRKDIKHLSSQVNSWRKAHKTLYDTISENQKLLHKVMKNKHSGQDGVNELKNLYSKSNMKVKDLILKQYELHYKKSKKPKSKREHSTYPSSLSPTREFRSAGVLPTQNEAGENTQHLIDRINALRGEINDLKESKELADSQIKDHENFKVKHSMLKEEYESIKRKYDRLKNSNDENDNNIEDLTKTNTKLNERISTLQAENKSLENLLSQNRDNEYESVKEFKNILNRAKKSCESQITNIESDFETKMDMLQNKLHSKDKKLKFLETKFNDFKLNTMHKLELDASEKLSSKISEIQALNSQNKDLKLTIDELTGEKVNTEGKLKQTQNQVLTLKNQLKASEEEQENLKKIAEDQENIASSLYEERLKEKNKEIDDLNKDLNNKDTEIYQLKQEAIKIDTKLCNFENKVKGVQSLVTAYAEQLDQDHGRSNPTIKLIIEELDSVITSEEMKNNQAIDRLNQMRELLKEKDNLEDQVNQLKWDIDKESSNTKRAEDERDRIQRELNQHLSECKTKLQSKDKEIRQLQDQLSHKEELISETTNHKEHNEKTLSKEKQKKEKLKKLLAKYKTFSEKI